MDWCFLPHQPLFRSNPRLEVVPVTHSTIDYCYLIFYIFLLHLHGERGEVRETVTPTAPKLCVQRHFWTIIPKRTYFLAPALHSKELTAWSKHCPWKISTPRPFPPATLAGEKDEQERDFPSLKIACWFPSQKRRSICSTPIEYPPLRLNVGGGRQRVKKAMLWGV